MWDCEDTKVMWPGQSAYAETYAGLKIMKEYFCNVSQWSDEDACSWVSI